MTRFFGLIIGDKVTNAGEHWILYKHLRGLVGLLSKPDLDKGEIQEIASLVEKHNLLFFKLFGKLKPKMHILIHYPRVIKAFGPVIHYSSLKFEQHNKILKEFVTGTSSNIQLPLTVATRNQLSFCYKMNFPKTTQQEIELGPLLNQENAENVSGKLKYVLIWNKSFTSGTICISRFSSEGIIFGKIKNILLQRNGVFFQIQEFKTLFFNSHYQAYQVNTETENDDVFIEINNLPKLPPCLYVKKFKEEFIATRYKLT